MKNSLSRVVVAHGFGRLEAPIISAPDRLIVSDVTRGGVHEIELSTGQSQTVIPHRKGIGGICLHEDGLVISGRNVSLRRADGSSAVLLAPDLERGVTGFNDMAVDAVGRIYVGALCFHVADGWDAAKPGYLYRIDLDGTATIIDADLLLPNGMSFSTDGRQFFQSDSLRRVVWSYPVGIDGQFGRRELFAEVPEGLTDGIAVDERGSVWVAAAYAGAIFSFDSRGVVSQRVDFESPMVTSICFSEHEQRPCMLVTTGPEDADPNLKGAIFRLPASFPGITRHIARVRPNASDG
jgi:sugar lactone lactonase YvrE